MGPRGLAVAFHVRAAWGESGDLSADARHGIDAPLFLVWTPDEVGTQCIRCA